MSADDRELRDSLTRNVSQESKKIDTTPERVETLENENERLQTEVDRLKLVAFKLEVDAVLRDDTTSEIPAGQQQTIASLTNAECGAIVGAAWHACFTGDCDHDQAADCMDSVVADIYSGELGELAKRVFQLRREHMKPANQLGGSK